MSPSGPGGTKSAPLQDRVNWAALKLYVAQKEAYEDEHNESAPLTTAERTAISLLLSTTEPEIPKAAGAGQDSGSKNWLGVLNHYVQVRHKAVKINMIDEARQTQRGGRKNPVETKWVCYCTIPERPERFPSPGFGMEVDDLDLPTFHRKMDAKQHAARYACEWLVANGYMNHSGAVIKNPAIPAKRSFSQVESRGEPIEQEAETKAPNTRPKAEQASDDGHTTEQPASQPMPALPQRPIPPPGSQETQAKPDAPRTPASNGADGKEMSAVQQVAELSKRLGFANPQYRLEPDNQIMDFWSGRPDFGGDPRVPDELGVVKMVFTRKAARERIAEAVMVWLAGIETERQRVRWLCLGGTEKTDA